MNKIRIGIVGYGNLGKGVETVIPQNPDMELAAVLTRRNPGDLKLASRSALVCRADEAASLEKKIDVMILCGGSAQDIPRQGPSFAALFNTVDSYDTHAKIPQYFASVDAAAKKGGHVCVVSTGWDPGIFSVNRLYAESILAKGSNYTFWGRGVSQGHSDAIRTIPGVKDAVQYTVPVKTALNVVRNGSNPKLNTREKHTRECYVVIEEGADKKKIEKAIKTIPNYFADYDTTVHFVSQEELKTNHNTMPHGGFVIRCGATGKDNRQIIEYSLKLDSNPEFTACVMVCYARAAHRLSQSGERGAKTVFDIAPALLSPKSGEELRKEIL